MNHELGNCEDFRKEKGALQSHACRGAGAYSGVMSPKGHCELAGQGIEYDWGKMKQNFRRKNKYKNFHGLIQDSMSTRKFARKARAYKRAPIGYRCGLIMSMRPLKKNGQVI